MKGNSPEMKIANLIYVQLEGHGGCCLKPTSSEWRLLVTGWPKMQANNPKRYGGKPTQTALSDQNTIHNPTKKSLI
jgi:hypothetical protein